MDSNTALLMGYCIHEDMLLMARNKDRTDRVLLVMARLDRAVCAALFRVDARVQRAWMISLGFEKVSRKVNSAK